MVLCPRLFYQFIGSKIATKVQVQRWPDKSMGNIVVEKPSAGGISTHQSLLSTVGFLMLTKLPQETKSSSNQVSSFAKKKNPEIHKSVGPTKMVEFIFPPPSGFPAPFPIPSTGSTPHPITTALVVAARPWRWRRVAVALH